MPNPDREREVTDQPEDGLAPALSQNERQEISPDDPAVQEGRGVTRRFVTKVLAFAGLGAVLGVTKADKFFPDTEALKPVPDDQKNAAEVSGKLDQKAKEIAAKVEAESKGLSDSEKALKVIDYTGCFLFAWGIKDLLPGGHGHIRAAQYGALLALTEMKYQLSDEKGRHHLKEETVSNAKAFGIISGSIVAAEGLNMDVEKAYQEAKGASPSKSDQVALMNMLASVLSPVATTVGSASIIRKMSNDLCDGDPAMMAVCTSHVSNLSGFLLFGDPPFIAICEKYGFEKGMTWQLKTMLPLALYSLFSSTYKLNLLLAGKEGLKGAEAHKKALNETREGLKRNLPVLARIASKSIANLAKYFSPTTFTKAFGQDPGGIEVKVGQVLSQKLDNITKLPFDPKFDKSHTEDKEGLIHEDDDELATQMAMEAEQSGDEQLEPDQAANPALKLRMAFARGDLATAEATGTELGIPTVGVFTGALEGFEKQDKGPKQSLADKLNPLNIYNRATSIHRIKEAVGHNLGDVVNVFPFQAGCVPFLTTAFKDAAEGLNSLGESTKEAVLFFLIMLFSSMADNYVACKIGLELFPNKPQIPLIASIQGGSLTAIGNMANVAQFSLDKFPLLDSVKQAGLHMDTMAASFAWAKAVDILNGMGIMNAPKPITGSGSEVAEVAKKMEPPKAVDRRAFLGRFLKRDV